METPMERARELVAEALDLTAPYLPADTPEHAEYDFAARLQAMAAIAAAGLALRDAMTVPGNGCICDHCGRWQPGLDAFDAAIAKAMAEGAGE